MYAVDSIDADLELALRENEHRLNLLDRIFKPEESDFVLGAGYVRGDFESVASVCFKEVIDERRCGRLGNFSLNYLIPRAIEIEYLSRGESSLPNGLDIIGKNIRKMLIDPNIEQVS